MPVNYIIEKIITGDKSDNVDGLHRIGPAMIKKHLIKQLNLNEIDYSNDFDKFINSVDEKVKSIRMKQSILDEQDKLLRNFKIMSLSSETIENNIPVNQRLYIKDFTIANPLFENTKDLNIVKMLNILNLEVNSTNTSKLNSIINKLSC